MTDVNVLEVLRRAHASVTDPGRRYVFAEWEHCLCGHIYQAASGKLGDAIEHAHGRRDEPGDRRYQAVLIETAWALDGGRRHRSGIDAADYLSQMAGEYRKHARPSRTWAAHVLESAIEKVEAEQHAAMKRMTAPEFPPAVAVEPQPQLA
jgi:hypothetical protein